MGVATVGMMLYGYTHMMGHYPIIINFKPEMMDVSSE